MDGVAISGVLGASERLGVEEISQVVASSSDGVVSRVVVDCEVGLASVVRDVVVLLLVVDVVDVLVVVVGVVVKVLELVVEVVVVVGVVVVVLELVLEVVVVVVEVLVLVVGVEVLV